MKTFLCLFALIAYLASWTTAEINCPAEQSDDSYVVQFPSPTSCSEFYKCDRGVPRLQKCPEGLLYNPRLQVCDYAERAGCILEKMD